jgi:hypothetical protein
MLLITGTYLFASSVFGAQEAERKRNGKSDRNPLRGMHKQDL